MIGDTITDRQSSGRAAAGGTPLTPMVFAGLYPVESREQPAAGCARKLRLNGNAFSFEPENSIALGFRFRWALRTAASGECLGTLRARI